MVGVGPSPPPIALLRVQFTVPGVLLLDGVYRTSDLYYAAYLRVAGVHFSGTERTHGERVFFLFSSSEEQLSDLKQGYFTGSARVPALSYVQMIREMKSLVYR